MSDIRKEILDELNKFEEAYNAFSDYPESDLYNYVTEKGILDDAEYEKEITRPHFEIQTLIDYIRELLK